MKNTILKFDSRKVKLDGEEFEVPDYFSKRFSLEKIIRDNPDAFIPYRLETNDKIEKIALDLYDNENYWDVIVLLNELAPLTDMMYDDSVIEESKIKFYERFDEFFGWVKDVDEHRYNELYESTIESIESSLEEHRYIRVVKSSYMPSIMRQLKKEGLT